MKTSFSLHFAGFYLATIGIGLGQPCTITINNQPQSQAICIGTTVTTSVTADGTAPLSYQWQRSGDQVSWVDVPEATNNTIVINNFQNADVAYYRVVVTNAECSVASQTALLSPLSAPAMSSFGQPTNWGVATLGANLTNRALATGSGPLSYQWRFNSVPLPGQTKYSIILTNVQMSDKGDYDAVVANICGAVTSQVARMDIIVPGVTFTRVTNGPVVTDPSSYWGCAWVDYDNDGLLDLFATTGGNTGTRTFRNRLYRNIGGGNFTAMTGAQVGPIASDQESWYGCSWGDYDNDGFLDVFIPNLVGINALYRNNGAGRFERIRNAGAIVTNIAPAQSGPWGDYDNDGNLDLFLASGWPPNRIALYHNQGGTYFTRVSDPPLGTANWTATEVATWGDYDGDGDLDLVFSDTKRNPLVVRYENRGQGVFMQITNSVWDSIAQGIVPIWADYDNDGRLDLLWHDPARLIHNDGNDQWTVKQLPTASGACQGMWGDYDNDGDLDLFFSGGQGPAYRNQVFQNNGDGTFSEITMIAPTTFTGQTSTCAWGDYDNDGFLDLVVVPFYSSPILLYHNDGNSNRWINIKLVGTVANRAAIGAKVRVQATIFGRRHWQMREVSAGNRAQNDLRSHFGLGDAANIETLRIEWPSGIVQELQNVAANQFITVVETQGYTNTNAIPKFIGATKVASGMDLTYSEPAADARYILEASTDLVTWTKLMARTSTGAAAAQFTDSRSTNYTRRFYRLQVP